MTIDQLYDFLIVNDGIDRRTSMLRGQNRRRPNPTGKIASENATPRKLVGENDGTGVTELTKSMSALKFVPRNLTFGRGGSKSFTR